jgi:hypothetical protein
MFSRILLGLLAIFWTVMTALLWRSEYLGGNLAAIPVDPSSVWQRVLTSPDSSSLAVVHQDERLGFCHLITGVADSMDKNATTNAPEGMVRNINRYRVDFSGSIDDLGNGSSMRFDGQITLSKRQEWQEFQLQLISRPWFVTVESKREEDVLELAVQGPDFTTRRSLRLSELSNPSAVIGEMLDPVAPLAIGLLPFPMPRPPRGSDELKLEWVATTDRLVMGNSASQIYRLELDAGEGMEVVILVSRAGEILRVDLPRNYKMVNEALSGL